MYKTNFFFHCIKYTIVCILMNVCIINVKYAVGISIFIRFSLFRRFLTRELLTMLRGYEDVPLIIFYAIVVIFVVYFEYDWLVKED